MLTAISFVAAGVGVSAVPASMLGVLPDRVVYCHVIDSGRALVAPLTLMCRVDEESPTASNLVQMATSLEIPAERTGALVD